MASGIDKGYGADTLPGLAQAIASNDSELAQSEIKAIQACLAESFELMRDGARWRAAVAFVPAAFCDSLDVWPAELRPTLCLCIILVCVAEERFSHAMRIPASV